MVKQTIRAANYDKSFNCKSPTWAGNNNSGSVIFNSRIANTSSMNINSINYQNNNNNNIVTIYSSSKNKNNSGNTQQGAGQITTTATNGPGDLAACPPATVMNIVALPSKGTNDGGRPGMSLNSLQSGSSLASGYSGAGSSPSGSSSDSGSSGLDSASPSSSFSGSSPSLSSSLGSIQAHSPAGSNFSSTSSSANSSSGSNVTAFLSKLWRLVNDFNNNDLICWSQSGCSFVIINQILFAKDLLPLYFKHSNMASFIRQLNMYGFRKIPVVGANGSTDQRTDIAQFYHVNFMRGQEKRLVSIRRKNNSSKAHSLVVNGTFCDEVRAILSDVKSIRDGQNSSESILGAIQVDNKSLWHDVAALRSQHNKQRRVVEKLIQFLLSLIQTRSNLVHGASGGGGGGDAGSHTGGRSRRSAAPASSCTVAELATVGSAQTRLDTLGGSQSGSPRAASVSEANQQQGTCSNESLLSPRRGRSPTAANTYLNQEQLVQGGSVSPGVALVDANAAQIRTTQQQVQHQMPMQQQQQLRSGSASSPLYFDQQQTGSCGATSGQLDDAAMSADLGANCQQMQQSSVQFDGQMHQVDHLQQQQQQLGQHNHLQQQQQQQQPQQQQQQMQLHQLVNQRGVAIYSSGVQPCFGQALPQHHQHQHQHQHHHQHPQQQLHQQTQNAGQQQQQLLSLGNSIGNTSNNGASNNNNSSSSNRQLARQASSSSSSYCYCLPTSRGGGNCGGLRCQQQQQHLAVSSQWPDSGGVYAELPSAAGPTTMVGVEANATSIGSNNYATNGVESLAASPSGTPGALQCFYTN